MAESPQKSEQAFRTIGELADELGVPQHILRYWETRFPQLKPLQRAGNRRYYRPSDVALAHRIHGLLNRDGYSIRGVQQLLSGRGSADNAESPAPPSVPARDTRQTVSRVMPWDELRSVRNQLAAALDESAL